MIDLTNNGIIDLYQGNIKVGNLILKDDKYKINFNLDDISLKASSQIEENNGRRFLTLNYSFKAVLITMFLSFGGISIHTQVMSILDGTGVKYMPYLVARLLHAAISGLIIYFII